jgi:Tfp pilus assembly protein PilF
MQQHLLSQLHDQQKELRLWVTGLLAETAMRQGYHQSAEGYFKAALRIKPNDTYILRTYSDYLLRQQRPKDVIQLLKTPPENDQLLLRFAIATKDLGRHGLEKKLVNTLEQRFANTLAKNNHTHGRDEAIFLLVFKADDETSKKRALTLAETNWKTQKEPDDTLTLLRAIRMNQDTDKQQTIANWVKQHKLQDQRLASFLSL